MVEQRKGRRRPAFRQGPVCPPQVKICGLTRVDEARACADLGADAVGLVFYAPSPRAVGIEQARDISAALPQRICRVGVFVNEKFDTVMRVAGSVGLQAVQLHGRESPELVERICRQGLKVVKALFTHREPHYTAAGQYPASAFLLECGVGRLPGGNARAWDFSLLGDFAVDFPLILAGGLSIRNITAAVEQSRPDAVDVSSGVESVPGRKDLARVEEFIRAVHGTVAAVNRRRIFNVNH